MNQEFTCKRSKANTISSWVLLILHIIITILLPVLLAPSLSISKTIGLIAILVATLLWSFRLQYRNHNMKHLIKNGEVTIYGLYKSHVVRISDIAEIKRTSLDMIKGRGSFRNPTCFVPGIGKIWVAVTNAADAVLIRMKTGPSFIVTPQNPDQFIEEVNRNK